MSLETTVGVAKVGTKSLRATVPEGIVVYLKLESGDKMEWEMEMDTKSGERVAVVRKVKE